MNGTTGQVAYFSMEAALESDLPTYSGGLGMLAGDTLRTAADLGIPMVGVTLVHRKGFFRQRLDREGMQTAEPAVWSPEERLEPTDVRVEVPIAGRNVAVRAWRYGVKGRDGSVPVYLLDSDLPENHPEDRGLTDFLYGGDRRYRLCQEAILGLGGIGVLAALDCRVTTHHMNEGHSALITIALLESRLGSVGRSAPQEDDLEAVRRRCVFTTHTPVPAGHDQFDMSLAREVLGADRAELIEASGCCQNGSLNMTYLALRLSRFVNGVAMRHSQVSRDMFPDYPINSITNGVHAPTWVSPPFQELLDRHLPGWRRVSAQLRYAVGIPSQEVRKTHEVAKRRLLDVVAARTDVHLRPETFTIGFARRATPYKRLMLLFSDLDRLRRIARDAGPLQIILAGKAHPADGGGQELIRQVYGAAAALGEALPVVYLEDYDMALAQFLCAGVDLWLNTPQPPQEASGTSGMKAALNGVPSFSVLDGWWIEGHIEGVTGWSIGDGWRRGHEPETELESLYGKLESVILPTFYRDGEAYARVMRSCIAFNGSFFNGQRMLFQYAESAYGV